MVIRSMGGGTIVGNLRGWHRSGGWVSKVDPPKIGKGGMCAGVQILGWARGVDLRWRTHRKQ
jgi:hypothetical protein